MYTIDVIHFKDRFERLIESGDTLDLQLIDRKVTPKPLFEHMGWEINPEERTRYRLVRNSTMYPVLPLEFSSSVGTLFHEKGSFSENGQEQEKPYEIVLFHIARPIHSRQGPVIEKRNVLSLSVIEREKGNPEFERSDYRKGFLGARYWRDFSAQIPSQWFFTSRI